MVSKAWIGVGLMAFICLAPRPAIGQAASRLNRAKAAYIEASRLYKAKQFDEALPLFREAYRLSNHRPSTVLGLAQCERQTGYYEDALVHYREYLDVEPNPPREERVYVDRSIAFLEAIVAARAGVTAPAEPPRTPPAPEPRIIEYTRTATVTVETPFYESYWFWTVVGVVVVSAGVTAAVLATRNDPDLIGGSTGVIARP